MKKIRKLTPTTLKRIIAEEKAKLKNEELKSKKTVTNSSDNLLNELKVLIKIKKQQRKRLSEIRKLHKLRTLLKNKLIKRV